MKKLFILFIIIINTSFFYDIYKKYQSIDISVFSGAINLQNADSDVTFEQTIYENNIEFINDMTQLADKYNITVVKRHIDIDQNIYQYYLYTNENINDLCDAIVYDKIDFHSLNEKNYYSNISKDDFSKKIFSLDYSSIINIKPFSYLYNNHDIVGDYSFKGKNVEKFIDEMNEKYKSINESFAESVDEQIEDETTSIEMNYTMLLICVVILFLILFGWLIKNKKIHSIYYLQGISHFCMIKDLYLKTFIVSMLCCLIVPVILFFVFVGEINSFTIHIVQSLWQISFLEIIVLIILLFILYLYLIFNSKIDGIHGKRGLKLFLNVNYVMKIVSLLILVPLVIQYANELMNEYYYNRYMIKNYEGIEDYMNIYTMDYSYMDLNYNQAEAAFGKVNPTILEYQHYYDLLEKQGAITFMYQPLNIGINEFVVNYQYLLQFPIQDTKGEILDLDLDTSSCFLLVPESLKDIDTEQFKKERDMNIKKVIVNDKQDYFRNLDAVSIEQLNNQNIIFVYGKQYNIGRRNPYDYIYIQKTIDEVDNIVKGSRFERTLKYRTLQDYIDNTQLRSPYYIFENTAVIILTLFLLIGILYENYCFYINLNMKQVMIKKMLGHRKIDIFKDLYLELIICYLPIFVFYRNNILIPVLLFVFDGILHFYISHYIYAKKTMNYLKGE